jgi:hypothetical protein
MLNKLTSWIALLGIMPLWVIAYVLIFEETTAHRVPYVIPHSSQVVEYVGPRMVLPKDDTIYMFYVNKS